MKPPPSKTGRGADWNPQQRFTRLHYEPDPGEPLATRTQLFHDDTRTIISRTDSPDVGFTASLNPYRGCEHGCAYCYARPTHEYLGWSAGLDFESRLLVKTRAPELLEQTLASPKWKPEPLTLSGVTDPYQPIERRLEITRRCLEVFARFRHPVSIITKNHLVTRDIDHLAALARDHAAMVNVSVTTLDPALAKILEPRASPPTRRLAAIRELSEAGIPVRAMLAPMIPGLNDHEIAALLAAVAEAGAVTAIFIPIRLPGAVEPVFTQWLDLHFPDRKEMILDRIRSIRGGRLNSSEFGSRMRGEGAYAESLRSLFKMTARKVGLHPEGPPLSCAAFRVPGGQMELF